MSDWELIVVDDASTDGGPAIVDVIAARDSRVRLVRQPRNRGAAVARNAATGRAGGRYIAFLDADDLWDPEKLERQVGFAAKGDHAFASYLVSPHRAGRRRPRHRDAGAASAVLRASLRANRIGCLTAMYDAERLGKVYAPDIPKRNDYVLWLQLLKRVEYAHCLPEVLAAYRISPGSSRRNKLGLARHHYRLFRDIERLSPPSSAFHVVCNVAAKLVRG